MHNRISIVLLVALATTFLGELKMNPLGGDSFRFSLGTAAFFFGIIWFPSVPPLIIGLVVGWFIVLFRTTLDMFVLGSSWNQQFFLHLPAAAFYFIFAFVLTVTNIRARLDSPIQGGLIGAFGELAGNYGELLFRCVLGESYSLGWRSFLILALFALLRSFFVIGMYNMLMVRQLRAVGMEQQNRMERLLLINTNLYEEGIWLRKSMVHIEEITRDSYELYRRLIQQVKRGHLDKESANLALTVAQEVHEVKKDCQRILAGLSKIIRQEELTPRTPLSEIVSLVVRANSQYAEMLGKKIRFSSHVDLDLATNRVYGLLSILNNLVANSVEAIEREGHIAIETALINEHVEFLVCDDGPGIQEEDRNLIFQPGFTTKYDTQGNPSTGIGLSHVSHIVSTFAGHLLMERTDGRTMFRVRIPTANLLGKESEHEAAILYH
ncbi:sensor histidine kinase [Collibacillus ludicampi]|uniref:histidine kinase n=1 Tax=Collibacillus ludicampi TaxID=2771369 RepID=A0AAV4LF53_9BACL|nr:sensor histidine kinase [Collibacillus ludicampi]GIM46457.1 sensor histidine kinase [Collibacillus ludicampi]